MDKSDAGTNSVSSKPLPRVEGYVGDRELASRLGLSFRTLARWRRVKYGPPSVKVGRVVLYSEKALAEWLDAQRQNGRARRSTR